MASNVHHKLTEGPILSGLIRLALPIMGASFIQMAYSLTDMFWIGFLGNSAVSAVGIAGFFVWLSQSVTLLAKTGTEIEVAQNIGAGNLEQAKRFAGTGLFMALAFALLYAGGIYGFRDACIQFFNTRDAVVEGMATQYLSIVLIGVPFVFCNQVFTGVYTGSGVSRTPFLINFIGLGLNMVLDPLLIHGYMGMPRMGVAGAAIATVIAQIIVFFFFMKVRPLGFTVRGLFQKPDVLKMKRILSLGFPPAMQNALFSMISMVLARMVAHYGSNPVGVQKVGSQIESITWMTAVGISAALTAFVGQNYGVKAYDRVLKSYKMAMRLAFALGIGTTLLLFFGAKWIFMIFLREPESVALGVDYLQILALSQLFMCIEITCSGVFNGTGHTFPPALISIVLNLLRIPMAWALTRYTDLGLNGIWVSVTISSIFKGTLAYVWMKVLLRRELSGAPVGADAR